MTDTVTISKDEYHALQVEADFARSDYIALHAGKLENLSDPAAWDAAVEALDA